MRIVSDDHNQNGGLWSMGSHLCSESEFAEIAGLEVMVMAMVNQEILPALEFCGLEKTELEHIERNLKPV